MSNGVIPTLTQGQRLQISREYVGLTQAEMAERLGVSLATVQRAETGRTNPRKTMVMAWSLASGVNGYWLETGKTPGGNDPDGGGQWWAIRDSNPGPTGSRLLPLRRGTVIPLTRELEPAEPAIAS